MNTHRWFGYALAGTVAAFSNPGHAFDALSLRSNAEANSNRNRTTEDSARPGESFFHKGVNAIRKEDYKFAVNMYEVSASWAFKPAQYNLGVMYFKGEGIPADRSRGAAWLALAAERGDEDYVAARNRTSAKLSAEEIARANEILDELKRTYADEFALKRAKNRWVEVRNSATGSHLGAPVGPLRVSGSAQHLPAAKFNTPTERPGMSASHTSFGITGADSTDASIAYRQLRESDNPYDPKFRQVTGTATVQPLIPVGEAKSDDATDASKKSEEVSQ